MVMALQMDEFKECIETMAAVSLRCVAFAYRLYDLEKVPREEDRVNWVLPEDDLILLGIVGIKVNFWLTDALTFLKSSTYGF